MLLANPLGGAETVIFPAPKACGMLHVPPIHTVRDTFGWTDRISTEYLAANGKIHPLERLLN